MATWEASPRDRRAVVSLRLAGKLRIRGERRHDHGAGPAVGEFQVDVPEYMHLSGSHRDAGIFLASDRSIRQRFPEHWQGRSVQLSNYPLFSLAAGVSAAYGIGSLSHNPHLKEAGILSGEAVFNSGLITSALQRVTGRNRPFEGNGRGLFLNGGTSFPSNHAAAAWSVATVFAHECPGPLTKLIAYGLASTVTVTRISGRQHFASDALVGGDWMVRWASNLSGAPQS